MSPNAIRQTVFRNGEQIPEQKPNTWRLYSMRLCPYAQRTNMVLAHKNIEYETVNVHLKEKPDWFLKRNPLGLVPVIERNDTVVYESSICNDYLEEMYPERPLYPKDAYKKARLRILMERSTKVSAAYLGAMRAANDEDRKEAIKNIDASLQPFEDALNGKFFGGDDLSMLDIHMWPWFERMEALPVGGVDSFSNLPKLKIWTGNMKNHPTVQATLLPTDVHIKFLQGFRAEKPDYDVGL